MRDDLLKARIIFVPGLSAKPAAEVYRAQLLRVLLAALERDRPRAGEKLAARGRTRSSAAISTRSS